jgi:putative NADH-flavin reductase
VKKLLVLGATGGTGQHVVSQALDVGHEVTAYVRDPAKLAITRERLRVVSGAITADALQDAMKGQDVVISTLGRGQSLKSEHVIERCVSPVLSAMKTAGVDRLIFTSAIGVGDAYAEAPLFSKLVIRTLLRDIYPDKLIGENLIRKSDLDWTIVQPAGLTNGPITRQYRAGEHLRHRPIATVSRSDLAHFLLSQVDDRTYVRRIVQLGY